MNQDRDLPLIEAIARQRDPQAFEVLLTRHRSSAFSLALAITGSWERGEDAVQEAMVNVWRAAGTYQPRAGATVRSWLMSVVARDALKAVRRARKERSAEVREAVKQKIEAPALEPGAGVAKQEALGFLRTSLSNLPQHDQQLVALAYGAEMSPQEIAKELAISRWTVTRRLEELLNGLRANLKSAGYSAALPLAHPRELGEAILSGCEPHPDLTRRILSRAAEAGVEAPKRVYRRILAKKPAWNSATLFVVLGILGVFAAGGFGLFAIGPASSPTPNATPAPGSALPGGPATLPEPPDLAAFPGRKKIYKRWTFEKGAPKDIQVRKGNSWRWVPAQAGIPARVAIGDQTGILELPLPIPEETDLEVRVAGAPSSLVWVMAAVWNIQGHRENNFTSWFDSRMIKQLMIQLPKNHCFTRTFLTTDAETITYWDSASAFVTALVMMHEARVIRSPRVVLHLRNVDIEEIEIRELDRGEIPERFRDPKKLIAELKLSKSPHPEYIDQRADPNWVKQSR